MCCVRILEACGFAKAIGALETYSETFGFLKRIIYYYSGCIYRGIEYIETEHVSSYDPDLEMRGIQTTFCDCETGGIYSCIILPESDSELVHILFEI